MFVANMLSSICEDVTNLKSKHNVIVKLSKATSHMQWYDRIGTPRYD